MISMDGRWYDGGSSSVTEALFTVYESGELRVAPSSGGEPLAARPRFDLQVTPRLLDTPRHILFPGGAKFETDDNETVDLILDRFGSPARFAGLVHRLESRWPYILGALALMICVFWGGAKYGVPFLGKVISERLPPSAYSLASKQTLDILDRTLLKPSELEEADRMRIEGHFRPTLNDHADLRLKVLFRKGAGMGPNAFALPDGTIIFTDEMVQTAEHDDELLTVLAHEIGHVVHRHGMRRVVQGSLLGFALLALTGDVSGSSEIFLALPVMLTELAYSRQFEHEADRYALAFLTSRDISPAHFVRLMKRIQQMDASKGKNKKGGWKSYLSTHPSIDERLELFLKQE